MLRMKRGLSMLLAGVMCASLLSGCSGGSSGGNSTSSSDTGTASSQAVESTSTDGIRSFVYGLSGTWNSWLLTNDTTTQNWIVHQMVFEPLVSYTNEVVYRDAESIDVSDDFMTWTVHLNPDVTWSDGEPTTADDWIWSLEMLTDPTIGAYPGSYMYNRIEGTEDSGLRPEGGELGVDKIDDYTFEIHWKQKTSLDDMTTSNMLLGCYPKHILGDIPLDQLLDDPYWQKPIGNGACTILDEPVIGQELVLAAREDYYRDLQFDQMTFVVVDESNAANSLLNGDIDTYYPELDTQVRQEIDGQNGISFTLDKNTRTIFSLAINNEKYPKEVRQAFDMLIDKNTIAQVGGGDEGVAQGDIFLIYEDYYQPYTHEVDVEGAKKLLDEAGYDYNNVVSIACGETRQNIAMIIQQNLAAAGVKSEITTGTGATIFAQQADGDVDAVIIGNNERYSPIAHVDKFVPGTGTYTHNNDDYTIADIGEELDFCTDPDQRLELTHDLQNAMWDICPWIFLYSIPSYVPSTEKLTINGSGIYCMPWDIVVSE